MSASTMPLFLLVALGAMLAPVAAGGFDLQGHRGARGLAPENTLPGFRAALEIGVTTLELDLGMSRDGTLVVSHDPTLSPDLTRAPDGRWLASPGPRLLDLDLDRLRRFDVGRARPGSRQAARFAEQRAVDGARIPTFEEVVELTRALGAGHVRFNVETKLSPLEPGLAPPPDRFARRVVETVEALGVADRTAVQSFDWRTLQSVRELAPGIPTVCLSAEESWLDNLERGRDGASPWLAGLDADRFPSVPDLVEAAGCAVWSPYHGDLDAAALRRAHDLGLEVVVWTPNEPDDMARLIELGVDGIITDYPDRLRAVLADLGRELPPEVPAAP